MAQQQVGVPAVVHYLQYVLPEPAHDLWAKGELDTAIGIPDDGRTRVEIIGGEIVVSPAPLFGHGLIASAIHNAVAVAHATRSDFVWCVFQATGLDLDRVADGYIPDLILMAEAEVDAVAARARYVTARQIAMTVEITSKSTAADDREPGPRRRRPTKWNEYAREVVPYYLLVDRDPKAATSVLFSEPDRQTGTYQTTAEWPFGETITLPEPFNVEIPTDAWTTWEE